MTESLYPAGKHLVDTCASALSLYKVAVKTVDSPAARRLVESIIAQKVDQLGELMAVTGITRDAQAGDIPGGNPPERTTDGTRPDIESLLKDITAREQALAQATSTLAAEAVSEEHRNTLNACAERSRKFASWTQDHLDLLSLF